jgi:tRNA threonylcarbamoyladenosine biosynthesis protein TsaB
MKLLAIDTSTECASVALVTQGVFSGMEQPAQRQHAQLLLPMIEKLLVDADLRLDQLDGIVFGRGPGSFTGLRITCSVVKGLAYAHSLPVFPVSSLAAIANEAIHQQKTYPNQAVLAMIDARMNQVYWACYTSDGEVREEQVSNAPDIKLAGDFPLLLAGVGYKAYLEELPGAINSRIIGYIDSGPSAQAMLRMVLSGKIKAVDATEALPVYIRNQVVQGKSHG